MKCRILLIVAAATLGLAWLAQSGEMQRVGHTTLLPRHSVANGDPADDKGMYLGLIDATNGYAYFIGNYLVKLDITGNLPRQVGPALFTGQFIQGALDLAAGIGYFPKGTLARYSLGAGTNPVTSTGSLSLAAGSAAAVLLDDADPNPANHYAYVLCTTSGSRAKVAKVALSTFTEIGSITLGPGETNFILTSVGDAQHGYAYFATSPNSGANIPSVAKVKMTPGTNLPVLIGAVNLDSVGVYIDGACIDTVHGYAYYGSYDSDTNNPGKVYKVKLESGDAPPTLVGHVALHPGEGRLAAGFVDAQQGFVYFGNDNSYPATIYRLSLNGTNLPVEAGTLHLQSGTSSTNPPDGVTADNTTTNADGALPFGEVYLRSAAFDPVRGYAYFGQDSRPNQVVKIKVAQIDPFALTGVSLQTNGSFQFAFTNVAGAGFSALATTNLTLPSSNWTNLGAATEISPGQFQFIDPQAANNPQRFYRVTSP